VAILATPNAAQLQTGGDIEWIGPLVSENVI